MPPRIREKGDVSGLPGRFCATGSSFRGLGPSYSNRGGRGAHSPPLLTRFSHAARIESVDSWYPYGVIAQRLRRPSPSLSRSISRTVRLPLSNPVPIGGQRWHRNCTWGTSPTTQPTSPWSALSRSTAKLSPPGSSPTGIPVGDDPGGDNFAVLRESALQGLVGCVVGEVRHVHLRCHRCPPIGTGLDSGSRTVRDMDLERLGEGRLSRCAITP